MKFDVKAAQAAGYSPDEIQSFLQKKDKSQQFDVEAAKNAGYSQQEIKKFLSSPKTVSRKRSLLSAFPKGVAKGAQDISKMQDPVGNLLQQLLGKPNQEDLFESITERVLPTQESTAEQLLERGGKLLPYAALGPESGIAKLSQLLGGSLVGQAAKEFGAGETGQSLAEAGGMSVPSLAKGGLRSIQRAFGKGPIEKTASGLPKLKATEVKHPQKGIVSPEKKKTVIKNLDDLSSKLAKQTVKKHLPMAEKISKGESTLDDFSEGFGNLRKSVEKFNPDVDVTPVSKFVRTEIEKYRGIPTPHKEGAKIKNEIRSFTKRPVTSMNHLYKIYRSNNKKMMDIFETSHITGKQKEYVNFLRNFNKKIAESFKNTLPENSSWLKEFQNLNSKFSEFQDTVKTLNQLRPILHGKATPANLEKLSFDPKNMKRLELSLGKEGAKEIQKLSKDLLEAKQSIKGITGRKLRSWDYLLPLSIFIPGAGKVGGAIALKKGYDYGRRVYGFLLTTPKGRKLYKKSLNAIEKGNLKALNEAKKEIILETSFNESQSSSE